MSTEAKKQPDYLDISLKKYINAYIDAGMIDATLKDVYENQIDLLFGNNGMVGMIIATLGEINGIATQHEEYNPKKSKVVITTEGSVGSIKSKQTTPKRQVSSLVGVLNHPIADQEHEESESYYMVALGMAGILKSTLLEVPPDVDLIVQTKNRKKTLANIVEQQIAQIEGFKLVQHSYNGGTCQVNEAAGRYLDRNTYKTDISMKPRSKKAMHADKRTGNSKQAFIQHPLTIDKNYRVIIEPNRRINKLKNPEKAVQLDENKNIVARTVISMRDFRKSLESLRSKKTKTPISKLSKNTRFIHKTDIEKIRLLTHRKFNKLDNYTKLSMMKEVIFMAELDPYAALWYLNITHLDKHLLGHHFDDIIPILNKLKGRNPTIEDGRNRYAKSGHHGYHRLVRAINILCKEQSITLNKPMIRIENKPVSTTPSLDPQPQI